MLVRDRVTNQPWREQALARIAEQRFVLDRLKTALLHRGACRVDGGRPRGRDVAAQDPRDVNARFVDQRARAVLENFGRTTEERNGAHSAIDTTPAPAL
jgi:hypothetical protein